MERTLHVQWLGSLVPVHCARRIVISELIRAGFPGTMLWNIQKTDIARL
jgi:hypothetical protein